MLVFERRRFSQNGQPVRPDGESDRSAGLVVLSWSWPSGQFPHARRFDLAGTCRGRRAPFLVGCHSAATWGASTASELASVRRRWEHIGHPRPFCTRLETTAAHSCPLG